MHSAMSTPEVELIMVEKNPYNEHKAKYRPVFRATPSTNVTTADAFELATFTILLWGVLIGLWVAFYTGGTDCLTRDAKPGELRDGVLHRVYRSDVGWGDHVFLRWKNENPGC